jgi:hypothetical protein
MVSPDMCVQVLFDAPLSSLDLPHAAVLLVPLSTSSSPQPALAACSMSAPFTIARRPSLCGWSWGEALLHRQSKSLGAGALPGHAFAGGWWCIWCLTRQ